MTRIANLLNLPHLLPGTVLRVNRGLYDHVALLGDYAWSGERQVLSFGPTPKCLVEIPFRTFAGASQVSIDGFLGQLAPHEVLARARELGEQRKYSWMFFNCEHFVRAAHGVGIESPQVGRALLLCLGVALVSS
jgi:hypothetical protein